MNRRTDSVAKIATKADLDLETVMNTRNNVLKMSTRHIVTSVAVAHFLTWCFNLNLPAQQHPHVKMDAITSATIKQTHASIPRNHE